MITTKFEMILKGAFLPVIPILILSSRQKSRRFFPVFLPNFEKIESAKTFTIYFNWLDDIEVKYTF